jgi:hypothetical protein
MSGKISTIESLSNLTNTLVIEGNEILEDAKIMACILNEKAETMRQIQDLTNLIKTFDLQLEGVVKKYISEERCISINDLLLITENIILNSAKEKAKKQYKLDEKEFEQAFNKIEKSIKKELAEIVNPNF